MVQLDGSTEQLTAGGGQTPASGVRDISDEMADVEEFDGAPRGGAELSSTSPSSQRNPSTPTRATTDANQMQLRCCPGFAPVMRMKRRELDGIIPCHLLCHADSKRLRRHW
jgi:hypothetical protein